MIRKTLTALLAASLLPSCWPAQAFAASASLPGAAAPSSVALPVLPLTTLVSPGLNLPGALPALPSAADLETNPAAQAPASVQAPVAAQARLAVAAQAAAQAVSRPGSGEADSRRVDFTQPARAQSSDDEAVPEAASEESPSALAPSGGALKPAAPQPPAPPEGRVRAYLASVFAGQLANNALIVTLPLLVLGMTHSLASIGFVTAVTTGFDMAGTLLGGWLEKKFTPRTLLVASMTLRASALLAVPAALAAGGALPLVAALFCVDALGRGVSDTARNIVPMMLAGRDKPGLDKLNSRYQTVFEFGGVAGPLLTAVLFAAKSHPAAALLSSAAGFIAAGIGYLWLPARKAFHSETAPQAGAAAKKPSAFKNPYIRYGLAATALLSLSPALKALLPAIFAASFLGKASLSSWLVLAYGLGGTVGSYLYQRWSGRKGVSGWLKLSALGAVVMAAAWIPGSFWMMMAGCLIFAATNAIGRLALTTSVQERIPEGSEGPVMGVQRFAANKTSMILRFLMGLAFAGGSPLRGMVLVGAGLGIIALGQFWMGGKLGVLALAGTIAASPIKGPKLSPVHGYPGRIIAVEGLDGSGKSTQMDRLKDELEAQGRKVVVTTWNSSDFVSEAVKKAKKAQKLTPKTFALLNAADFQERLETVIIPALKEGSVVLADRWFFTALARDSVRGNDPRWLRSLYKDAPRPDLTLYFKLPVDTAISRVMSRSGKPSLSEDFEDEGDQAKASGPKHYEAGLDLHLSEDPIENFRLFQTRVTAAYDAQVREFGLKPIDASRSREEVSAAVSEIAGPLIAQLAPSAPAAAEPKNLFDKDPAGDSEDIRLNYLRDKKGVHLYFRNMLERMQERFAQLMDHKDMPKVFLHGSGHVDNYAKSASGAAMIDFDRSRYGPYAWDLVRTLVSVSLRRKKQDAALLDPAVSREFLRGYLRGLRHPDQAFSEMHKLKNVEPKDGEQSVSAYLKANKKWAKEMRDNPLPADDAQIQSLVSQWAASRGDDLLKDYYVKEAGRGHGSMGQRAIYLVLLAPREKHAGKDKIFLSVKQARTDPDTEWYKNPFPTQAERMIKASELYAPGFDQYQGSAWLSGVEYHVRAIPPLNAKLKKMLGEDDQKDFLYAVGTQFGRAHRLSVQGDPALLEAHVKTHYAEILKAGLVIRNELAAAHRRYLDEMRSRGLTPPKDDQSEE